MLLENPFLLRIKAHRASILEAEFSRLSGAPTYTMDQVNAMVKEKFRHAQSEN